MPTNNPTGKNQYTDNDKRHGGKQAGASERSGSSPRSAGSRSDDNRNKSGDSGKRGSSR